MAQESRNMDKDETGCQPPEGPILCVNNCGFFGNAATMNLCSQCYRNIVLKQTAAATAMAAVGNAQSLSMVGNSKADGVSKEKKRALAVFTSDTAVKAQGDAVNVVSGTGKHLTSEGSPSLQLTDSGDGVAGSAEEPPRQSPNRCFSCRKRVGLTGFKCRCGNVYCALHRYSDKHGCTYDYHGAARDAIAKANPVIKADKVDKI